MIVKRPTVAFILSLIGGTLILSYFPFLTYTFYFSFRNGIFPDTSWAGLIIVVASILFYEWPQRRVSLGALVIAFSLASLAASIIFLYLAGATTFGMLMIVSIIGSIVALTGGIGALIWNPDTDEKSVSATTYRASE